MNKCTDLKLVHYADDSTANRSNSSLDHLIVHVNSELTKISDWLCANRLPLDVSKASYSIYSNKKVKIARGETFRQINEIKFLRVIIDDKL